MNKQTSSWNHSYFYTELQDQSFSYAALPECHPQPFAGALELLVAQRSLTHITDTAPEEGMRFLPQQDKRQENFQRHDQEGACKIWEGASCSSVASLSRWRVLYWPAGCNLGSDSQKFVSQVQEHSVPTCGPNAAVTRSRNNSLFRSRGRTAAGLHSFLLI